MVCQQQNWNVDKQVPLLLQGPLLTSRANLILLFQILENQLQITGCAIKKLGMRIGFLVINWPFKWSCRFPFCRYSYTRNLCFPSAQYPIKETRFGCSSPLKMSTSTRNSRSPSASLYVGRSLFLIATTFRLQKRIKFVCFSKTGFNSSLICFLYYMGTKFAEGFWELKLHASAIYIYLFGKFRFYRLLYERSCLCSKQPFHHDHITGSFFSSMIKLC